MRKRVIILLGQPGVGKTTLCRRLQNDQIDYLSSGEWLETNRELKKYFIMWQNQYETLIAVSR